MNTKLLLRLILAVAKAACVNPKTIAKLLVGSNNRPYAAQFYHELDKVRES